MRIFIKSFDSPGVERGRSPLDPVNGVTFCQKKLGKICAILPSDSRNQGDFSGFTKALTITRPPHYRKFAPA